MTPDKSTPKMIECHVQWTSFSRFVNPSYGHLLNARWHSAFAVRENKHLN